MLTAEEALEIKNSIEKQKHKEQEELKRIKDLVNSEKLIPVSYLSITEVEGQIIKHITEGYIELENKLQDDVISNLKEVKYKCYLCKKVDVRYYSVFDYNKGFSIGTARDLIYTTVIVWDDKVFNETDRTWYESVKEL